MNAPVQPWITDAATAGSRLEVEGADERLTRSGAPETRGDYSARQDAERAEAPNMSDDEIEAMISAEFETSGNLTPPDLPGFHLCWLTTTSQFDTIQKRARVGYRPVMRSEMPGYEPSLSGEALSGYEGMVTCNELILHKIPVRTYQLLMNLFHHKRPLASEASILKSIEEGNAKADNTGGEGADGISTLERSVKAGMAIQDPRFVN
jgi:hypothetical protein